MRYIRKISDYAIAGGIGAMVIASMQGCEQKSDENTFTEASKIKGAFVVIDELENGGYKIAQEYPSDTTRVIVRGLDGSEKILSSEEMDALVREEQVKIDNNTSALTNSSLSNGAPGLGSVLLSSVAGALIGSYIGNRLFNNQNFQNQRAANYKTPQAYSKSVSSFSKAAPIKGTTATKKSTGFFGSKSTSTTGSKSFLGFGG